MLKSMPYLGSFLGFLIFPALTDNYGRRFSHTIALVIGAIGCILMACAYGDAAFPMMLIGFLTAGFSINPGTSIHFAYLKEITCKKKKKKK
jgi:MFS family permease